MYTRQPEILKGITVKLHIVYFFGETGKSTYKCTVYTIFQFSKLDEKVYIY